MAEPRPARSTSGSELDLGRSLLELKGIGPVRHRRLIEEGISCLGDLLLHVPRRYEDRRHLSTVAEACVGVPSTFSGRLSQVRIVMRRGRRFTLVKGVLEDATGSLVVSWFNRPYLPSQVEEGEEYLLHGEVRQRGEELELQNPSCERMDRAVHTGRITPVYSSLAGLGPMLLRRTFSGLLDRAGLLAVEDPIPAAVLRRHDLPSLGDALAWLHLPDGELQLDELNSGVSRAHQRLIYGELLSFQVRLRLARQAARDSTTGRRVAGRPEVRERLEALLPFTLTEAQHRVIREIESDLGSNRPMRRLVQGDVGSGKTVVAAGALMMVMDAGFQGAFMAPTELLAEQHFETFEQILGGHYRVALLTGSTGGDKVRFRLESGDVDLVVGTHALIQETVRYRRPGLAVIDEQHRFGVAQRRRLGEKGAQDLLVMTATPIPRSLTLTAYGDLDLSIIDELPPGRRPVVTRLCAEADRHDAYAALLDEVERGGRGFVVFPAIGANARQRIVSLERGLENARRLLPGVGIGVMHGQMPPEQRAAAMARFVKGETPVLLATTVIEVGVDVPAATVMIIEGAERFGLAQLHQLRGRVGRGDTSSSCFAVHGDLSGVAERRLEVFARTNDGFEIAEVDLEIRGPGEVLGTRQSGVPSFRVADLARDVEWIRAAREDAVELLATSGEAALADLAGEPS